jgi:DNA-binding GntR family transcriptional regulator
LTESATRAGDIVVQVHTQLRQAILSGEVRPGEKTSQAELARDLGVGRTPLREAVRMLQSEGLVVTEPNRRVVIARLSLDDVEQLYIARITLEASAARVTLPQLTDGDIAELEGLMAQMAHLASGASGEHPLNLFAQPHRAFHERLIGGAGSRLAALTTGLFDHSERYRRVYGAVGADHFARRHVEHRGMLDAAESGDADAFVAALTIHYVNTARLVAAVLDPECELSRLQTVVAATAPAALRAFS